MATQSPNSKLSPTAKRQSTSSPITSRSNVSKVTSPPTTNGSGLGARGTTARPNTVANKASPFIRKPPAANRASTISPPLSRTDSPAPTNGGDTSDTLEQVLNKETEAKELLLTRIQELEATVTTLTSDNDGLKGSLAQAENRLKEMYADQLRMEEEMAARLDLVDKLRSQVRELEKEKRDVTRRYQEQTTAFDAERQSFYDNEQHLKSRIQSLTQARKEVQQKVHEEDTKSIVSEVEYIPSSDGPRTPRTAPYQTIIPSQEENDDSEPAEMTALRLELSTLSTSYTSLQSTVQLLQAQLQDLKRVNAELQEENEGWSVLVQQRTLAGTFDVLGLGGSRTQNPETMLQKEDDGVSLRSAAKSGLDRVSELDELAYEEQESKDLVDLDPDLIDPEGLNRSTSSRGRYGERAELDPELVALSPRREGSPSSRHSGRSRRRGGTLTPKGESLAELGVTGPGLDLAAELGRAENSGGFVLDKPPKAASRKKSAGNTAPEESAKVDSMENLVNEVKSLRDANKALSLYAAKIIDRIVSMEGFEHVLAVDYQQQPATPVAPQTGFSKIISAVTGAPPPPPPKKPRPASMSFAKGPQYEKLTTFDTIKPESTGRPYPSQAPSYSSTSSHSSASSPPTVTDTKRARRSLSFDFRGFSLFGGQQSEAEKRANDPHLRPLTLRPGINTPPLDARKVHTEEDEEDRRERERVKATMRLMGIEQPETRPQPQLVYGSPSSNPDSSPFVPESSVSSRSSTSPAPAPSNNRWSMAFFRRNTQDPMQVPTPESTPSLTAEALRHADAESHLAALDAREKAMKEEISKGGGSGFTEISTLRGSNREGARRSLGDEWRSRRSGSSGASLTNGMSGKMSASPPESHLRTRGSKPGSDAGSIVFNVDDHDV